MRSSSLLGFLKLVVAQREDARRKNFYRLSLHHLLHPASTVHAYWVTGYLKTLLSQDAYNFLGNYKYSKSASFM